MKKFSKILTLVLAIVALASVFAVVALAEEELTPVLCLSLDFEGEEVGVYSDGKNAANSEGVRTEKNGRWDINAADNGNKYLVGLDPNPEAENALNGDNKDFTISGSWNYNVFNYPIFAFDFDFMSNDGTFNTNVTMRPDLYGGSTNGTRIAQGSSIKLANLKMDVEALEWYHGTLIMKYVGGGKFDYYFYHDGKSLSGEEKLGQIDYSSKWDGSRTYENIRIGVMSYYPSFNYYSSYTSTEIAYDNFKYSYYPEGYDVAAVAAYVYNESYEMPYGQTEAIVNDTVYDDVNEALAALKDGDKLTLKTDLDGVTVINKAVTVDTNKYDENGDPTGECYKATVKSTDGYIVTLDGGVYTLAKAAETVTVVFDPKCSDETCTCYGDGVGHRQTYSVVVPVGEVPEFLPEIQVINDEGLVADFLGWSYDNDGTVDAITAVTSQQAQNGTLNIYPVYEIVRYAGVRTDADGNSYFFMKNEFDIALKAAIAAPGSVITLYSDIEYIKSYALPTNTNIKIDLNGHKLTRIDLVGAVYNYDNASGTYVAGTAAKSAKSAFTISSGTKAITFTMTSAKDGAEFRTVTGNGTAWYNADGGLDKYELTSVTGGANLFNYYYIASTSTFTFENLTVYALGFMYGSHNGTATHYLNIYNCNFYRTTAGTSTDQGYGYDCIFLSGKANVHIKDSLFYFPSNKVLKSNVRFIRVEGTGVASALIENSDIITDNTSVATLLASYNHTVTYKNSRVYNISNEPQANVPMHVDGTLVYNSIGVPDAGYMKVGTEVKKTYSLPTNSRVTAADNLPVFEFGFEDRELTFDMELVPAVETEYQITDARFSFVFYSNFKMVLYLPVEDGVSYSSVNGFTKQSGTVLIEGKEFYVFKRDITTTGTTYVFDAVTTFKKDGVTYVQNFELSALIYANIILSDPDNDIEANAVANMLRYIKESCTTAGLNNASKFTALEALYPLDAYKDKAEYSDNGVDYSGLDKVSMKLGVYSSNATYIINLAIAEYANAANAQVTVTNSDGTALAVAKPVSVKTNNVVTSYNFNVTTPIHIYDMVDEYVTISITIPATATTEEVVLTGTYSVGAYIQATDNSLAKAVYEFGVAAKAYREYLLTL